MSSGRWTKDQLKLAFHLYCQLPFGRLHHGNPEIIELAKLIGRTPSAVAMKLVNFASLDPTITGTGRRGLANASKLDREVWAEFNADWEGLALECHRLRLALAGEDPERLPEPRDEEEVADYTGETRRVIGEQRIKQSFFRRAVLGSYGEVCCMSGIRVPRLLVASHIVPWARDRANRLNPRNGLCLSALHDRAFDQGLITVTPALEIRVSPSLGDVSDNEIMATAILALDRKPITAPRRFLPDPELLAWHNENRFVR